eukprot:gene14612-14744_t
MELRNLGNSDLKVPVVCLGTMTFGEQNSEEESFEIMDYALSRGVNFLDTAELYPVPPSRENNARTEIIIGNWMKARGNRDQVVLATKVASAMPGMDRSFITANRFDPPKDEATTPQPNLSREQILDACDASLRRLQTNYIDLYQLHCNETTFGVCQFAEAAKRLGVAPPVSIQNDFSPFLRTFEGDLAEACALSNYNIGGKYLNGFDTSKSRHTKFPGFQPRYHHLRSQAAARDLVALASSKGMTAAQLAQAWAASRWYMGAVIIGATSLAQAKENIDACLTKLDEDTEKQMDELFLKHGNVTLQD